MSMEHMYSSALDGRFTPDDFPDLSVSLHYNLPASNLDLVPA
jgi:hypothetical protein